METVHQNLRYASFSESSGMSIAWPLLFATLVHILLLKVSVDGSLIPASNDRSDKAAIVVDAWDPANRKPVVTTSRSQEEVEDAALAPFHSDIRNRVKKQTRSPLIGKFQESQIKRGEGGSGAVVENGVGEEAARPGEAGEKLGMHELMSFAKTPHALSKDIPEGGQTVLNTDKVLYASFLNRIADEIYEPWVQYAQDGLKEILRKGRKVEPTTYITKLNVVMNTSGEVVAMTVMETSGFNDLDDAPKKAFWKIARFPNPPSQLMDKDSLIRLNYEFHFEWGRSFYNIVPYRI